MEWVFLVGNEMAIISNNVNIFQRINSCSYRFPILEADRQYSIQQLPGIFFHFSLFSFLLLTFFQNLSFSSDVPGYLCADSPPILAAILLVHVTIVSHQMSPLKRVRRRFTL